MNRRRPKGLLRRTAGQPLLTADEERDLVRLAAAGDRAATDRLVLSHLRVVVRIARSYGRFGLPVSDLIQEGTMGLIQAVRRFNPERDVRLSTYAMWWIRAAIQDYVVRSWSLVRVGKTAAHRALFFALKRPGVELEAEAGPSEERARTLALRFGLPVAEVVGLARRIAGFDLSLDAPMRTATSGLEEEPWIERLPAPQPSPEDLAAESSMTRLWAGFIDRTLTCLPAREAAIIRRRHLSEPVPTLEALGRELGLSKDRVRQLERRALQRLHDLLKPLAVTYGLPGR